MTSDENHFFRQVIANRIWRDMMGRGLVEPVDDLRDSNPPTNAELLEALAIDLRDHDYDLKHLIRRIASSYVYGLSSLPTERNIVDSRNYSRFLRERLRAAQVPGPRLAGRSAARFGVVDHRRSGRLCRHAGRLECTAVVVTPHRLAVPRRVRTTGSESGSAL